MNDIKIKVIYTRPMQCDHTMVEVDEQTFDVFMIRHPNGNVRTVLVSALDGECMGVGEDELSECLGGSAETLVLKAMKEFFREQELP
jgi:hypothetical protein